MMTNMLRMVLATVLLAGMLAGCNDDPTESATPGGGGNGKPTAALPAGLLLTAEPADAKGVVAAMAAAKDGDKVTIRGRVGGRKEPFAEQRATMAIVDLSLPYCGQSGTGRGCKKPWDYCCEPQDRLAKHMVSVQVDGANGKILHRGLKGAGGIKELAELVVQGVLRADATGARIVHATGIYVMPG